MKGGVLLIFLTASFFSGTAGDIKDFFTRTDNFMKKYVKAGAIAYAEVKKNKQEIDELYTLIAGMNVSMVDEGTKKAFYINSYNLAVIHHVVKNYPIKSPMDVPGFFDKVKHVIAGEELTLNDLEHKRLLRPYADARFHFVLVCAARSCPPLASFAYMPDKTDQQLNERTILALNDPAWLKVIRGRKAVEISKIFEWYKKDFTTEGKSVLDWINKYRTEKIPSSYNIGYYEYDWRLNE